MSLRSRILLSVAGINLAVTVLLAAFFSFDLDRKDTELRRREAQLREEVNRGLEQSFGTVLEEDSLILEVPSVRGAGAPQIYRRLLEHPVQRIIEDGIILDQFSDSLSLAGPAVVPTRFYMNLKGAKRRAPDFSEQHARFMMRQAKNERRLIEDGDWIAAPIYLKEFSAPLASVDFSKEPWGAGYFKLLPRAQAAAFTPLFESSNVWVMVLGTLLLVGVTGLILERSVLRPLAALSAGAARVAERRYDQPVPPGRHDEMGRLIESFNAMMAEVQASQRDLAERVREATQRAEESRRGLMIAQRLAATGTLVSGIAHEINNPLGGMLNATRRLKKEAARQEHDPELEQKYLDLLADGLHRVQEIVRRVLAFSPRQMEPVEVSLREVIRRAVEFAEHRAQRAGVAIEVAGPDARVLAVPGEIQQVVLNLLLNACDAMAGHGGRVVVRLEERGDTAEVHVQDEGPGLTPEECERVFDLFYTTKEVTRGTGLGLSVAHHIVEQHGGRLTVRSEPGEGATFTVSLPRLGSPRR